MSKLRSICDIWKKYQFILTVNQKRWGIVVVIMTLLGAIFETLGVSIILPLVQVMIAPQELKKNSLVAPILNFLHLNEDAELIWAIGIAVIAIYLIKNGFLLVLSYVRVKFACKVQRELSIEMLDSYMKRGYVFFMNAGTGELLRGMLNSISNTYTGLYQIFKLFAEAVTIAFICVYIMISDIVTAICVILLAIICLVIVLFGCQKWVKKCGEIHYKYTALINKTLIETFQSIKEILVMKRQRFFIDSYKDKYVQQQKGFVGQTVAAESPAYIIEAICVGGLIATVCFKAIATENAAALVPQLAAFAVAAFRILPSLGRISNNFNQFMFCIPGINDTYGNLLRVRNDVDNVKTEKREEKRNIKYSFADKLSVDGVSWKYPDAQESVLQNISLEIKKGQSVAFVGKSGAGKTTLADVLLGLLQPQSGRVLIDGVNIADMADEKEQKIGFVPQIVNLLDDTVRRNVAFGVKDQEIDDDLVWRALEQAQLKVTIEGYEQGLDTIIGERGIHFSGGQRQRFAIARALYSDPDILILDEATSALDTETETAVMESIEALQGEKTLIVIAHRITTIRNCDVIYEIADGRAIERNYREVAEKGNKG